MQNYYKIQFQPRFRDLDGLNHVNNAVFITYLENARFSWHKDLKFENQNKEYNFIIAHVEVDYLSPIKLISNIEVKMWVSRIGKKSWDFSYEIVDFINGNVYAKAKTTQVYYDYKIDQSLELPNEFKKILQPIFNN